MEALENHPRSQPEDFQAASDNSSIEEVDWELQPEESSCEDVDWNIPEQNSPQAPESAREQGNEESK